MVTKITLCCCLLAACATYGTFAFVMGHHQDFNWAIFLVFGTWDSAIYAGIALHALAFGKSRRASRVMLLCVFFIAGYSLYFLYLTFRVYFIGNYTPDMMNCGGPIVELGLPLLQLPTLLVFAVIAFLCGSDRPPNFAALDPVEGIRGEPN